MGIVHLCLHVNTAHVAPDAKEAKHGGGGGNNRDKLLGFFNRGPPKDDLFE